MKKKKTSNPSAERVTPFAEIQKMTPKQAVEQFVANIGASVRMFAVCAKLMLHLAVTVKAPQTVGGLLRGSGIRKTTIDNARQHARVFEELVLPKHITEAQFDALSFAECVVINRAMSGGAKEKQTGKKVAALMKSKPDSFDLELDCLARYGHSRAKQDKVEKDATAKAEKEQAAAAKLAAADGGKTTATTDGKTPPTTPAAAAPVAPGKVVPSGITKHTPAEAIAALEAAEAIFNELTPVQAAEALPKLKELHAHVTAYVGTIKPPSKTARRKIIATIKPTARKVAAKSAKKQATKKAA